jgi:hypothetical protein
MRRRTTLALLLAGLAAPMAPAAASHTPGGCTNCASHRWWPSIDGVLLIARDPFTPVRFTGTERSDELLGHHGSDVLNGGRRRDVLWGDYDPDGQPATQVDRMYGGRSSDFIYGSHGRNRIFGGPGNDAISVHYGRGLVDCGPGRDIYHVARSRKHRYRFRNCEKVEYRTESQRGGGLRPLR